MRSSVASNMAESNPPPFPFCFDADLDGDPFSTTETGVSDPGVEGRRALVFNLGLTKGFHCLRAQSGVDNTLAVLARDESNQLATLRETLGRKFDSALQPDGPPSASPYKQ
jgi:hypothetical protein